LLPLSLCSIINIFCCQHHNKQDNNTKQQHKRIQHIIHNTTQHNTSYTTQHNNNSNNNNNKNTNCHRRVTNSVSPYCQSLGDFSLQILLICERILLSADLNQRSTWISLLHEYLILAHRTYSWRDLQVFLDKLQRGPGSLHQTRRWLQCTLMTFSKGTKMDYLESNWLHTFEECTPCKNINSPPNRLMTRFFVCLYWNPSPADRPLCQWRERPHAIDEGIGGRSKLPHAGGPTTH